jgi:hypothetical protein
VNPIKEWLALVAAECGSPFAMRVAAGNVRNENTRKLIVDYADHWHRQINLRRPA